MSDELFEAREWGDGRISGTPTSGGALTDLEVRIGQAFAQIPSLDSVVKTAQSLDQLRSFTPIAGVVYQLKLAGVDEGTYSLDVADTTTTDDGMMVVVTENGKRLKRLAPNGIYYARKGDATLLQTPLQRMADSLAAIGGGLIMLYGRYRINELHVPQYVIFQGLGGQARFGAQTGVDGQRGSTFLYRHTSGGTTDLTTVDTGGGFKDLTIEGRTNATGTNLVVRGFETTLNNVRVLAGGGIGFDGEKLNNIKWRDIWVDNCGMTAGYPAAKVWSKAGATDGSQGGNETNNAYIDNLTIERQGETALQIAVGSSAATDWGEWIGFRNPHFESPQDNGGTTHTAPLVEVGNMRVVEFNGGMMYGGTGPIIRHDQQANRTYLNGGLKLIGTTLLGLDSSVGNTAHLIHLKNGNDFKAIACSFGRYTTAAVLIDSTYGPKVHLDPSCTYDLAATLPRRLDSRTSREPFIFLNDVRVEGHETVAGTTPTTTLVNGAASLTAKGCDAAGMFTFGSAASGQATGIIIDVTFNRRFPADQELDVAITGRNSATRALQPWASVTRDGTTQEITGFKIRVDTALGVSQGSSTYQLTWRVTSFGGA